MSQIGEMVRSAGGKAAKGRGMGIKLLSIVGLVMLLAMLLGLLGSIVDERSSTRDSAVERTVDEWGGRQDLFGPVLRLPYERLVRSNSGNLVREYGFGFVLPATMDAQVRMQTEKRSRGIFEVPLYTAKVAMTGSLHVPQGMDWLPAGANPDWDKAELWFFVGNARGLATAPELDLGDGLLDIQRATYDAQGLPQDAFSVRLAGLHPGKQLDYSLQMSLRGGAHFGMFPAGDDSRLTVRSDWPSPEFGGAWLPTSRRVDGQGFEASWEVPAMARPIPSNFVADNWAAAGLAPRYLSFETPTPVDSYRMTERSVKYGLLFILIPFAGFFLFELFAGLGLHPVQYLMVGLAVLMFFLLLLSLSERMDFTGAFIIASLAVVLLVTVYTIAVLGGTGRGLACGGGFTALYVLLYLIVSSEDNALMVGTLFLFALLSVIMLATRKVNWYALGGKPLSAATAPSRVAVQSAPIDILE